MFYNLLSREEVKSGVAYTKKDIIYANRFI